MSVVIEGLSELLDTLDNLTTQKIAKPIHKSAIDIVGPVRKAIADEAPVDSGDLRDSIIDFGFRKKAGKAIAAGVRVSGKELQKRGNAANQGALVEFGTSKTPSNPFFSRGWKKSKSKAEADIKAAVSEAIDQALK